MCRMLRLLLSSVTCCGVVSLNAPNAFMNVAVPTLLMRRTWYVPHVTNCNAGGGCGVGFGLGWGYGAAWGSKYIIIEPEFESGNKAGGPRWLAQLQQQLRIQKFEKSHQQ